MTFLSRDLQANYCIIQLLENSKARTESIIEQSSDLVFLINAKGSIFFLNTQAAFFLKAEKDFSLGKNLFQFFSEESAAILQEKIQAAEVGPQMFELSRDQQDPQEFTWVLKPFGKFEAYHTELYLVEGRDITHRKRFERFSNFFNALPVGVIQVNRNLEVESTLNEFTSVILERQISDGESLKDVLFTSGEHLFDQTIREGVQSLMVALRSSHKDYNILSMLFPKVIPFLSKARIEPTVKYLGLKISGIFENNQCVGAVILLEDRTIFEQDADAKILTDQNMKRFNQISMVDQEIFLVTFDDLDTLFEEFTQAVQQMNLLSLRTIIHSIKASARLINLDELVAKIHAVELKIRASGAATFDVVVNEVTELFNEWKEVKNLKQFLFAGKESLMFSESTTSSNLVQINKSVWRLYRDSQTDAEYLAEFEQYVKDLSLAPLKTIELQLMDACQRTSKELGKRAYLKFSWDKEQRLDIDLLKDIRVCLSHLITNSLDHGIESPEVRIEKDKKADGKIVINALVSNAGVTLLYEDDGAGLDREKIEERIKDSNLAASDELSRMSADDVCGYIFRSDFSTKEVFSKYSGAGIGLSAVKNLAEAYSGFAKVHASTVTGAKFEIFFPLHRAKVSSGIVEIDIDTETVSLDDLLKTYCRFEHQQKVILDLTAVKKISIEPVIFATIFRQFFVKAKELICFYPAALHDFFSGLEADNFMSIVKAPSLKRIPEKLQIEQAVPHLLQQYVNQFGNYLFTNIQVGNRDYSLYGAGSVPFSFQGKSYQLILRINKPALLKFYEGSIAEKLQDNWQSLASDVINIMCGTFKETLKKSGYYSSFDIPVNIGWDQREEKNMNLMEFALTDGDREMLVNLSEVK